MNKKLLEYLGYVVNGLSIILYFLLLPVLPTNPSLQILAYPGFLVFGVGLTLIVLSIVALTGHRNEGLYTRGVYSLVRHPLYLGAMLLYIAFTFFCPHWIMLVISVLNSGIVYAYIQQGDRQNIEKFGDPYREYSRTVPQINLLTGVIRSLRGKR